MDLTDNKINEFLHLLASDAPAPGGGAAAALAGALGAALIEMVTALTKGKEKYREYEAIIGEISDGAGKLREKLSGAVNRDAEAFNIVSAAYKMEKGTPEQAEARSAAIESALKQAADAPMELMEFARDCVILCERAVGKSNVNLASDLGVSAVLLGAAARGARIMVEANLSSIKDASFVSEYREKSERLLLETDETVKAVEARVCTN